MQTYRETTQTTVSQLTSLPRSLGSRQTKPEPSCSPLAMRPVRGTPSRSRTPSGLKASPTASPRDVPSGATTPRTCGPSSQTSAKHRARTPPAAKSLSTRPAPKAALRSRVAPVADALARALSQEFLKEKVDLEALAKEILSTADVRALAVAQSSESEEEEPPRTPTGRARRPDQTVEMRLRQALRLYALSQNAKDCAENLSYLEEVSVGPQVNVSYKQEARAFFEWATQHHLALVEADEIDNALVAYMNSLFFQGHQAWRGQKLLASIAFLDSSLGRNGARKIPRSWRALKGWMIKTPPRSRLPQPWMLWCGIMADLSQRGFRGMAVMLLLMVTCYLRPSDAMRMRHGDVVPPAHGVSRYWSLLLHRAEHGITSKTKTVDDSLLLDTPSTQPWIATIARVLRQGKESDFIWTFSYPDFTREFGRSVKRLGIEHSVVPYMARHSGPSIDRVTGLRDLMEIQKRGRWLQFKSVQRYEKHARLAEVTNSLSAATAAYMMAAEVHLEAVLLHRLPPLGPPPRA